MKGQGIIDGNGNISVKLWFCLQLQEWPGCPSVGCHTEKHIVPKGMAHTYPLFSSGVIERLHVNHIYWYETTGFIRIVKSSFLKTYFCEKVTMPVKLITRMFMSWPNKCLFFSQLFEFLKLVTYERSNERKCFTFLGGYFF